MLSDQPRLSRITFMALLCRWGWQSLKDMTSLGTDFEMHAIWQAGVRWGSHCKGFCSEEGLHYCFEQSAGNPTINLIHEFGNPLGIPHPSVLRSIAGLMSGKNMSVQGLLWVRKAWFVFAQWIFAWETFGERRKRENSPVLNLLAGSHQRLALRNPCILCQIYEGACTTYQLRLPKVQETAWKIGFQCSQKRCKEISN